MSHKSQYTNFILSQTCSHKRRIFLEIRTSNLFFFIHLLTAVELWLYSIYNLMQLIKYTPAYLYSTRTKNSVQSSFTNSSLYKFLRTAAILSISKRRTTKQKKKKIVSVTKGGKSEQKSLKWDAAPHPKLKNSIAIWHLRVP